VDCDQVIDGTGIIVESLLCTKMNSETTNKMQAIESTILELKRKRDIILKESKAEVEVEGELTCSYAWKVLVIFGIEFGFSS